MKKIRKGRSALVGILLIAIALSAGSGLYVGASFFGPLANVTVTTTIFTTTTSWVSSTVWSTATEVVSGILTTIQYTSSTSTVTVTGPLRTAKSVTANGNAHITTAQSVFGGASGAFNGVNSYLTTPDSPDWYFGAGDFTIDFRVRFSTLPGSGGWMMLYVQYQDGTRRDYIGVYNNAGAYQVVFHFYDGTSEQDIRQNSNPNLAVNTWYHVALVRSGNSWYIFQNGSQLGSTVTNSRSIQDYSGSVYIGKYGTDVSPLYFSGWLDEFRVSKGIARWTSNFTPPASAYSNDANTVLLLHMDGLDGSTTFTDSTS